MESLTFVRRYWTWGIPLLAAVGARLVFVAQTRDHTPSVFTDSAVFAEIAAQPFSIDHVFYPKPLLVPALYRVVDADPWRIVGMQQEFAFWSWLALGLALYAVLDRWPARIAGLGVAIVFLFAPVRLGWAGAVLSESLNDSLMVLGIAALIALGGLLTRMPAETERQTTLRQAVALVGVGGIATVLAAWLLARDTNAITLIAAAPVATILAWSAGRGWRWAASAVAAVALLAGVAVLWTAQVELPRAMGITLYDSWSPEMRPRGQYPMANNIFVRVLPDPEARAYFVARGMPMADALDPLREPPWVPEWNWDTRLLRDAEWAPFRAWLVEDGTQTYVGWLARHPLDRVAEVSDDLGEIFKPAIVDFYMPGGWERRGWSPTESTAIFVILAGTGLVSLWRPRRYALAALALCLVWSGLIGILAAYYGDGIEIERHTYGSAQQVLLGLALATVASLEVLPIDADSRLGRTVARLARTS